MIGVPNSPNLNCKVRVMKEAPGPSVSEEIADIFRNYNIDDIIMQININMGVSDASFDENRHQLFISTHEEHKHLSNIMITIPASITYNLICYFCIK